MNDIMSPDEYDSIMSYLLNRLKQTGTPTWSDTPGMGNQQLQTPDQAVYHDVKPDVNRMVTNQLQYYQPGSQQQQLNLEKFLIDRQLEADMYYLRNKKPRMQPFPNGPWEGMNLMGRPMGRGWRM